MLKPQKQYVFLLFSFDVRKLFFIGIFIIFGCVFSK